MPLISIVHYKTILFFLDVFPQKSLPVIYTYDYTLIYKENQVPKPFRNIKNSNVVRIHVCMTDMNNIAKDTTISIDTTLYAICKLLNLDIIDFCKQKALLLFWTSTELANMSLSKYLQQSLMKEVAMHADVDLELLDAEIKKLKR